MKLIIFYFKDALKRYPKLFLWSFFLIIVVAIMNASIPYILRIFLDDVTKKENYWYFVAGLFLFSLYFLIKIVVKTIRLISLTSFGGNYIKSITLDCYETLAKTSLKNIDQLGKDNIKHAMYDSVLNINAVIGNFIPTLIGSFIMIIITIFIAFFYNFLITLFILASLILGISISYFSRRKVAGSATATRNKLKYCNNLNNKYIDAIVLTQTNNILPYFLDKTTAGMNDFIKTAKKDDKVASFWQGIIENYNILFNIILSALLSLPISGGSIINLIFFTTLSSIIMSEGNLIEILIQSIVRNKISFENINQILELPARQGSLKIEAIKEVTFSRVSFSYDNTEILKNINCTLKPGDNVLISGDNGSGKSTFIKLLTGIYSATTGELLLNNQKINSYSQESLNNQILYISQDETLINESISNYLKVISGKDLSSSEISKLLKSVNLDLEDRNIENNGLSLSVGQRKKLLIAKLMLNYDNASVIILDEIEAGLDQETKIKYHQILNELFEKKNKIFLIIEHNSVNLSFNKTIHFKNKNIV